MGAALGFGLKFLGRAAADTIPAVTRVRTITRISCFTIFS
jgi:hypothetical protein